MKKIVGIVGNLNDSIVAKHCKVINENMKVKELSLEIKNYRKYTFDRSIHIKNEKAERNKLFKTMNKHFNNKKR